MYEAKYLFSEDIWICINLFVWDTSYDYME